MHVVHLPFLWPLNQSTYWIKFGYQMGRGEGSMLIDDIFLGLFYHKIFFVLDMSDIFLPGWISYLWTYVLYGPVCNAFDVGKSITRASGRGLGPRNPDFFGALWNGIEPSGGCHFGAQKAYVHYTCMLAPLISTTDRRRKLCMKCVFITDFPNLE